MVDLRVWSGHLLRYAGGGGGSLENLRIMGLAIAGLRIALAGGVDEKGACQWWYAGYVAKVCMAVGGRRKKKSRVESRESRVESRESRVSSVAVECGARSLCQGSGNRKTSKKDFNGSVGRSSCCTTTVARYLACNRPKGKLNAHGCVLELNDEPTRAR
jgi:hypothetical protein